MYLKNNCQSFHIWMILLELLPTFFLFLKYIDSLCLTKIQGLIWWWFHLVIIACYTIVFALPCSTGFKKRKNNNLGTWGKYSLHWLQIAIYLPVSSLFWLLTLSNMLDCTNHKTEDKKIFQNLYLLCCKLSNHIEHKSPGLLSMNQHFVVLLSALVFWVCVFLIAAEMESLL